MSLKMRRTDVVGVNQLIGPEVVGKDGCCRLTVKVVVLLKL